MMASDSLKERVAGLTAQELLAHFTLLVGETVVQYVRASRSSVYLMDSLRHSQQECAATYLWTLSGKGITGPEGKLVIRLNDYLCAVYFAEEDPLYQTGSTTGSIANKPRFIATPRSDMPVLLTTIQSIEPIQLGAAIPVDDGQREILEAIITVMAWNLDGTPAAKIAFDWHCVVEGLRWAPLG